MSKVSWRACALAGRPHRRRRRQDAARRKGGHRFQEFATLHANLQSERARRRFRKGRARNADARVFSDNRLTLMSNPGVGGAAQAADSAAKRCIQFAKARLIAKQRKVIARADERTDFRRRGRPKISLCDRQDGARNFSDCPTNGRACAGCSRSPRALAEATSGAACAAAGVRPSANTISARPTQPWLGTSIANSLAGCRRRVAGTTMERAAMSSFDNPVRSRPPARLERGAPAGRIAARPSTTPRSGSCNARRSRARTSATRASSPRRSCARCFRAMPRAARSSSRSARRPRSPRSRSSFR